MKDIFWHFAAPLLFAILSIHFFVSAHGVDPMEFRCDKRYLDEKHTRLALATLFMFLGMVLFLRNIF